MSEALGQLPPLIANHSKPAKAPSSLRRRIMESIN